MAYRRHGDPLQTGLEVAELAPFVRTVRRVIDRNKDRVSWPAIFARWDEAVGVCHAIEAEARAGKTYIRWRRQAAALIAEIAENVEASRVFELVAAVYLYAEIRPERFASDAGFNAEVLHVVRREAKAGRLFTVGAKSSISYRLLSGRVSTTAARFIIDALGNVSLAAARAETKRLKALEVKATEQRQAIAAIE